jgi:hypothetical protein
MIDFTINAYTTLLSALREQGYAFQTFVEFLKAPAEKAIVLRHDVDARKENSLRFAEIQHGLGIKGSYYFRVVSESYDEEVIRKIAAMGHEVGYHYETMDLNSEQLIVPFDSAQGDKSEQWGAEKLIDAAYVEFCRNLEMFRKIVPVETICMHGSPRSKYDNKDIWKKYDYKQLGLLGEPYYDIDFSKVAYLTDTGRRWNGDKVSIRDRVKSPFNFNFRTTRDIIRSVDELPDQVMFTFHPQRWTNNMLRWIQELIAQNLKNQLKRWMV